MRHPHHDYDIYANLNLIPTLTPTSTPTLTATQTITPTLTITRTPTVTSTYEYPTLKDGNVIPGSGNPQTWFEYVVHYEDADGGDPLIKELYVNNYIYDMNLKSGRGDDGLYN